MINNLFLKVCLFLTLFFTNKAYGQITIYEGKGIDNIILGSSTISDVVNTFGKDYKKIFKNNNDKWEPNLSYTINKSIMFPKLGITFQCYDTTDLIIGILLEKPFIGVINNELRINLDSSTNNSILEKYVNLDWRTTKTSKYWALFNDENYITFYTLIDTSIKPFPIDIDLYRTNKINSISLKIKSFSLRVIQDNSFSYYRPLYASDSCTHLNAKEYIEYKREYVKHGIWQEYYSNHKLKSIGMFKKDYPVGEHKIFNKNGSLIQSIIYSNKTEYIFYAIIIISIVLLSFLIIMYLRKNKNKPKHYLYVIIGFCLHFLFFTLFPAGCGGAGLIGIITIPFIIILSILLSFYGYYLHKKNVDTKLYHVGVILVIIFISYYLTPFCLGSNPITLLRDYLPW